jgi:hypothetical protein
MIQDLIPSTVQSLVLFENFNEQYLAIMGTTAPRSQCLRLHHVLAELSIQLRMLLVSFMANAGQFFDCCDSSWTWQHLTSLTLTSNLLVTSANTNAVLQKGAEVALRMPNLEIMELWNGRMGLAALFQYRSNPGLITWKGTWKLMLQTHTIQAWEVVAKRHGTRLGVVYEMIDESNIACLGDAIHHLGHSERVLRPVSLHQIRLEETSRVANNQNEHWLN